MSRLLSLREVREALAEARQKAGLSQAEAAKKVGVSQPYWHRIENTVRFPDEPIATETLTAMGLAFGLEIERIPERYRAKKVVQSAKK